MIFNQFSFLFLFLPAVLFAFYFPPFNPYRRAILITASFIFYGLNGLQHLVILLIEIVWVWSIIRSPRIVGGRALLALAVSMPAAGLIYFKYAGFLFGGFGHITGEDFNLFSNVILPAGISFFTFQVISMAIDRYRNEIEAPSLGDACFYVSFFAHLVAGPILRWHDISYRLANLAEVRATLDRFAPAIALIVFGLAFKVLIADTLGAYQSPFVKATETMGFETAVFVTFAYSFQIYFDFYGYSLIAIGLGKLFGFTFPNNFDRPYLAANPKIFWRKWHITLSSWLRDYVYLPLGGNRKYVRNIIIVFLACGLWHGAGWQFILWGAWHALLVLGYAKTSSYWDRMPVFIQVSLTFLLVSLGWHLFQFNLAQTQTVLTALAGFGHATAPHVPVIAWFWVACAALVSYAVRAEHVADITTQSRYPAALAGAATGLLLFCALPFIEKSQDFIYFRF